MPSEVPADDPGCARDLETGELQLAFQPIVDLHDGSLRCVEALVRWDHPTRGLLFPGEFLDTDIDLDASRRVTGWVLNDAAGWAAHWRAKFPEHPITVAVNLSDRDLDSPTLAAHLANVLRAHELAPGALALEVGESSLYGDLERASDALLSFRDLGVQVFVDDFGTAYSAVVSSLETMPARAVYVLPESVGAMKGEAHDGILMSLALIESLPIDVIKIDRRFVQRLLTGPREVVLVESVVRLCHRLGFQVQAEGVEHEIEVARLREVGCDLAQGYYFHRPLQPEYIDVILREATVAGVVAAT